MKFRHASVTTAHSKNDRGSNESSCFSALYQFCISCFIPVCIKLCGTSIFVLLANIGKRLYSCVGGTCKAWTLKAQVMTLMYTGMVVLCLSSEYILLRVLVFLTQHLLNKTFSDRFLHFIIKIKKCLIHFNYPSLFSRDAPLLFTRLITKRHTVNKTVRNNEYFVSHNPNRLIDSCNLFYCIAAVVPCWPTLWKGGRVKKK